MVQVQTWAKDQGFDSGALGKMRELEVDGDVLLHIEPVDIREDLGVSSGIQAKKLFLRIKALHEHNIPMGVEPLSFWQHRAMNRKAMDTMVLTIGLAPRTAMTYFKMFPKAAQPAEPIGGWLEWLFVPEYYICKNADTIVGGLPGNVPACLFGTLVLKVVLALGSLVTGKASATDVVLSFVTLVLVQEIGGWICATLNYHLIYPIMPWFLSDFFFYFGIYVGPLINMVKPILDAKK